MVQYRIEYLEHNLETLTVSQSTVNVEGESEEQVLTILEILDSGLYSQRYKDTTPKDAKGFVRYEKTTNDKHFRVIISE